MILLPPRSTRTDTLFPYTTLFRSDRARILAINLGRLRWLDRTPPATRIDVNTAAAMLDYWHEGAHAHRARVIVGQPGWETPQLGSPLVRLVANPNWTVPKSIAEEDRKSTRLNSSH